MKTRLFSNSRSCLSVLTLALCAAVPRADSQTDVGLSIQAYAGLSITGAVGTVYTVQYTTNLAQSGWRAAGIVQLPSNPYLWIDATAPATGRSFYRAVAGPTNLVWIPPGTFTMGSPSNEVEPLNYAGAQTVVTLTRGFFMGKYEVTQGEYADVVGVNPSYFRNGTIPYREGTGDAVTNELCYPVEQVNWYEATNYCAALSERERSVGRLPAGWVYRLPTEAEWEYACRGGTASAFHYGPALRSGMANFDGRKEYDSSVGTTTNSAGIFLGRPTIVGSYEPNGWGLFDMHGNVWEWCSDWWSDSLPGGRVVDPQGPSSGPYRVFRGGCWLCYATHCRSATRLINGYPFVRDYFIGFRVALAARQ